MNKRILISFCALIILLFSGFHAYKKKKSIEEEFLTYQVDLRKQDFKLYWKDNNSKPFKSIRNLKDWLQAQNKQLVFAMNAGMYLKDNSPQGLFIQEQQTLKPLDTTSRNGNFYLKPNGVFYTTKDNKVFICSTENYLQKNDIQYATQSGPMLVINGEIHPAFKQVSSNVNIRNGVGILSDNKVLFVMSKEEVNLYDFAKYFKDAGCKNALYLDGFVSRTYLPEKDWTQTDGNFGVIIGVTK